jgi:hypothetical protein
VTAAIAAIAAALGAWLVHSIRHQLRPLAAWPARPDRDPTLVPVPVASGPSLATPAHDWESGATGALEPLVPETGVPPLVGVSSDQTGASAGERSLAVETSELGHVNEHSSEPEPELDRDPDPGLRSRLPLSLPEIQEADSLASTAGEASPRSTTIGADHHRDGLLPPPDDLLASGSGGLAPGEVTAITPPAPGVDGGAGNGDDKLVPVTQADGRCLRAESS